MASKYEVGQQVRIKPAEGQSSFPRDSAIEAYAGKSGKVTDYYWISTGKGDVFYIYTVRMDNDKKAIVLHEDEIEAHVE